MTPLKHVERQKTALLQLMLLLQILGLGMVTLATLGAWRIPPSLVGAVTVLCLLGCLFTIGRERKLTRRHGRIVRELMDSRVQITRLSENLESEQQERIGEQARTSELEERLSELRGLYRAIAAVNAASDSGALADSVLRAALDLVSCSTGSVMLLDEHNGELYIASAQGIGEDVARETRLARGQGVAGWVLEHGEPLLLQGNVRHTEAFSGTAERSDVRRAMSVPVMMGRRVCGVLNFNLSSEADKETFSESDLRVAAIFAQHAASALERDRLLQSAQASMARDKPDLVGVG